MIAFEMAFLMVLGVIAVVTIAAVGRPMAEAYAEKVRFKYKELGSESEILLKERVAALEQELADLKRQVTGFQDTADFAVKLLEKSGVDVRLLEPKEGTKG